MLFCIFLHSAADAVYFLQNPSNFFFHDAFLVKVLQMNDLCSTEHTDRHTETISKKVRVATQSSCSSISSVNTVKMSANTYTGQGYISCASRCSISMSL